MKYALGFLMILSFHSQAQVAQSNCLIAKPCQYSEAGKLGYCVASVNLRVNRGRGTLVVAKKAATSPIRNVNIPVKNASATVVEGSNHNGDDWFSLDVHGNRAVGVLTMEQDFPFAVVCELK